MINKSDKPDFPITNKYLEHEDLFIGEKINIQVLKEHFYKQGRLRQSQALEIITKATQLLQAEPNLIKLKSSTTICGDIHGQFYDLLNIFEIGNTLEETSYLFLGDYVDRGSFSTECVLLLWALKINYPNRIFLLRGNHECERLSTHFSFKKECLVKYNLEIFEAFINSFKTLPLAAILNKKILCVHAGISQELIKIEDINKINRFVEPSSKGLICDLLWSDPNDQFEHNTNFVRNKNRGCSYFYSYNAISKFLIKNNLLGVIRAHQVQNEGYKIFKKSKIGFPSLISVFSAPNYLDIYKNKGAILTYINNEINIKQFEAVPHPYCLPNFMDLFTWSLPFVGEKITSALVEILKTKEIKLDSLENRKKIIKNKIIAVGKVSKMFTLLRNESELVNEIKNKLKSQNLPQGFLSLGAEGLKQKIKNFDEAKIVDENNERLPPSTEDSNQ